MQRILIHPGSLAFSNLGDIAMLVVAAGRLRRRLPGAEIAVLSGDPRGLRAVLPDVREVPAAARDFWLGAGLWPGSLPQAPWRALRRRLPALARALLALKARLRRGEWLDALSFLRRVERTDLLVLGGAGLIADPFRPAALRALETIALSADRGVPSVLLGQGIGPLGDPVLRRRAAEVLPRADLVLAREEVHSVPLLRDLGVPAGKIVVTGDDALALAVREPAVPDRNSIGVSLRVAPYSGTGEETVAGVRRVLSAAARRLGAPLLGLPIALGEPDPDPAVLDRLLAGAGGGPDPPTLPGVLSRTARCRVVVTGSYHAGVFALGQGIPVVAVAASAYYRAKFDGLAGLFPGGCRTLDAGAPGFEEDLAAALTAAWAGAPGQVDGLRAAAAALVARAEAAGDRIPSLLRSR